MRFKSEDFKVEWESPDGVRIHDVKISEAIAQAANIKLEEWLNNSPIVYGYNDDTGAWTFPNYSDEGTHKAKLVCIEKLNEVSI